VREHVDEEGRSDLVTHLNELRTRVIRSAVYVLVTTSVVWFFFDPIYEVVLGPVIRALKAAGGEMIVTQLMEGFLVKVEISFIGGIILAAPLIYYEIWAFVAPGLTRRERRTARPLVPVSGVLFLMGVVMAYLITGPSVQWLLRLNPPETVARYRLNENLLLLMRFYLAFGLGFQIPIVIILLAKLGLVDSRLLTVRWREATVIVFVIAAVITPTWDPITMTIAALPMVLLYLGTIGVVRLIERAARRALRREQQRAG
jgi:sec-independent protein translocase protein TatC